MSLFVSYPRPLFSSRPQGRLTYRFQQGGAVWPSPSCLRGPKLLASSPASFLPLLSSSSNCRATRFRRRGSRGRSMRSSVSELACNPRDEYHPDESSRSFRRLGRILSKRVHRLIRRKIDSDAVVARFVSFQGSVIGVRRRALLFFPFLCPRGANKLSRLSEETIANFMSTFRVFPREGWNENRWTVDSTVFGREKVSPMRWGQLCFDCRGVDKYLFFACDNIEAKSERSAS